MKAFLRTELLLIQRDPMLPVAAGVSLLLPALMVFGWDSAIEGTADWFDLAPWTPMAATWVLQIPGLLVGWVMGFVLLDERDDGVLPGVTVTPKGLVGFGAMRGVIAWVLSFALSILAGGFALDLHVTTLLLASGMAALCGPLWAGLLAALANNKVEGLAVTKVLNLVLLAPVTWIVWDGPLAWLGAWTPTFWVMPIIDGQPMLGALGGVAVSAVWLGLVARRLRERLG